MVEEGSFEFVDGFVIVLSDFGYLEIVKLIIVFDFENKLGEVKLIFFEKRFVFENENRDKRNIFEYNLLFGVGFF